MNKKRSFIFVSVLVVSGYISASVLSGSDEAPYTVPRKEAVVVIDGKLDENVWQESLRFDLNYETDPGENIPAAVKTEVFVFHDEDNLYFGLICYDPNPSAIRARFSERDNIFADDLININLDTFNDERRNYYFGCNPLGAQRDGIETVGANPSWDAIWDSAGDITEKGYTVEIAIPFSSLQFQRTNGPQIWGLDVSRWYQRSHRRRLGLVKIDRNNNSYQSQFLKIIGFEGIKPGKNIEVIPTLTGTKTDERESFPQGDFKSISKDIDPGLTIKWGITTNLTLNGTVNPDFSQVEADTRQLDINQPFALFYQEKRPFFIEGMDFFRSPFSAVYTRTLRDPIWGIKLTGKETSNTIGAYYVKDDLTNIIFPGNQGSGSTSLNMQSSAGVFRYKKDFGNKYAFGTLFTNRDGEDYFNRVFGFDGEARLTNRNRVEFQFLGSSTKYPGHVAEDFDQSLSAFNDRAFSLGYRYQSRNLNVFANYQDIGTGFRADLGFMPIVDFRQWGTGIEYSFIKSNNWWSVLTFGYRFFYTQDHESRLLYSGHEVSFFFRGALQSYFFFLGQQSREVYRGVEYDMLSATSLFMFQPTASLQVAFSGDFGERIDYANSRSGQRVHLNPSLTYNLGKRIRLAFNHNYEKMNAAGESLYTANISQGSIVYHLNTKVFLRAILQYVYYNYNVENYTFSIDREYTNFFTQILFSYRLNPRTVVFLGYTDNYLGTQEVQLTQTDRTLFLKIGYSWQF
jgi:hypothetical protein